MGFFDKLRGEFIDIIEWTEPSGNQLLAYRFPRYDNEIKMGAQLTVRDIMTELKMSDAEWQAFISDRQGAVVGKKLVTLYGFTPGQRITLKSPIYNQSVEFIIRGICTGGDEKTMFFHNEYLNELLPEWARDQASTFSIMANSAGDVPRIAQTIDSMFVNSDAPTKTESEREFALSF